MAVDTRAPETRVINATQASERLGVHLNTILRWIEQGKISATKESGEWQIRLDDIDNVARRWRTEFDEFVAKSDRASALRLGALEQLRSLTAQARILSGQVVEIAGDVDRKYDAEPEARWEVGQTFERILGELQSVLNQRSSWFFVYEQAQRLYQEANEHAAQADMEFNSDRRRRALERHRPASDD